MDLLKRVLRPIAALPPALRIVLFAIAVLHGLGLSWGMPSSTAWDNDGVAPRDILPGLAATFTPGEHYTYPPLHLALLAVLSAPVTIIAVLRAGSTSVPAVIHEILAPPYMTAMSMIARITCLSMSLGIVVALAKITEEIAPPARAQRSSLVTVVVAGIGMPFTYYSHTSNLDVPYLFWASLAALELVRTIVRHEPRRLRRVFLFAVFAIATKDQAYAVFIAGVPVVLATWLALDPWPRSRASTIVKEVAIAAPIAIVLLLAIDGALTNPSGFQKRITFLTGSASQDYATYEPNASGRLRILVDLRNELHRHYPWSDAFAVLYAIGFVLAVRNAPSRAARAAAVTPLALAASFTLAFNMVARRVEERFTLPQVLFLAIYAGIAIGHATSVERRLLRRSLGALAAILLARSAWWALELDVNLLYDPRYATEDFLARMVKPDETIEVHGLNVYLPRLPAGPRVMRVGRRPPNERSPIPGVEEVEDQLVNIDKRRPHWVVVSDCYAWRFFPGTITESGKLRPVAQARDAADRDAFSMYVWLFDPAHGYRTAHVSEFSSAIWKKMSLHASVGCKNTVLHREDAR